MSEQRFTFLDVFVWSILWEMYVESLGGKLDVDLVNWKYNKDTETLHLNATLVPPVTLDCIKLKLVV